MSIYLNYKYKDGLGNWVALTSDSEFAGFAVGTQIQKNTGEVYEKLSSSEYGLVTREILGLTELDARYPQAADGTGASGTWPISVTGGAVKLTTTNWTVEQLGSKLIFKYGATTVFSINSNGEVIASRDITAYGTP